MPENRNLKFYFFLSFFIELIIRVSSVLPDKVFYGKHLYIFVPYGYRYYRKIEYNQYPLSNTTISEYRHAFYVVKVQLSKFTYILYIFDICPLKIHLNVPFNTLPFYNFCPEFVLNLYFFGHH